MEFIPHSAKQEDAIFSDRKITLCGTGIQWGKSRVGAVRMKVALHTHTAEDDTFLILAPTYKIMNQSTFPAFKSIMTDYWEGNYNDSKAEFKMPGGGTVYFRTGKDPDSIVGATNVRHVWGDEAGKFSLYFWENIQARASFKRAPITLTTSPYALNWVFKELIRPKMRNPEARPDCLWIKARSDENPYFPADEYEDRKSKMDPRRFRMMYGGEWDKMEGLVYSCFDDVENICDPIELPSGTRIVAGVDWGYTHPFVIVVRAITPTGYHYQVSEFYATQLTIDRKIEAARRLKTVWGIEIFYCDPARPDDIAAFNAAKLRAIGADNEIQGGIERHFELIKSRRFKLYRGTSPHSENEYESYHYPDPDDDKDADAHDRERGPVDKDNHCCLAAGTMISMPHGERRIEDIVAGDLVSTPLGPRSVRNAGMTGWRRTIDVSFSDGTVLSATPDHPVYCVKRGFRPIDQCDISIACRNGNEKITLFSKVVAIVGTISIGSLLAVLRLGENVYMWLSGSLITDLFQMAMTCTTRITTFITTTSAILWPCQGMITARIMDSRLAQNRKKQESIGAIRSGRLQSCGMGASKDDSGIKNTPRTVSDKNLGHIPAAIAARVSSHQDRMPNTARTIASRLLDAKAAWIILTRRVNTALRRLEKTDTRACEHVLVSVVGVLRRKLAEPVYNLTIDTAGCFFANGILVSNCDASRYVTTMTWQGGHRHVAKIPDEKPKNEGQHARIERLKRGKMRVGGRSEDW